MSQMSFLTEFMVCNEGIKLGSFYDRVCLGQVYELPKWIYFDLLRFICDL